MIRTTPYAAAIVFGAHLSVVAFLAVADTGQSGEQQEPTTAGASIQPTLHWKHTVVSQGSRAPFEPRAHVLEKWLNLETGESYRQNRRILGGTERLTNEAVFDGRRFMLVYHERNEVYFGNSSPIQGVMQTRLHKGKQLRRAYVGDPRRSKRFSKIGEEEVAGTRCDVWSAAVPVPTAPADCRVRAWLDAETDQLLRLEIQDVHSGRAEIYEVLERGRPIPPEMLDMEAPAGFAPINTKAKDDFQKAAWGGFANGHVRVQLVFSLPDGAVLAAWSLFPPDPRRMRETYGDLELGDSLPTRPIQFGPIRTSGLEPEIELVGCHLAFTEDGKNTLEWSIHLPTVEVPPRSQFFGYALSVTHGWTYRNGILIDEKRSVHRLGDFPIRDGDDFRQLVTAAMEEYSTDQPESSYPSFEQVMRMSSLMRQAASERRPVGRGE